LVMFLVGNALSGIAAAPELLPQPWGAVGQWFPPGAGATLLRDLSYFPDADVTFPWLVLAGWAIAGVLLALVGRALDRAPASGDSAADDSVGAAAA